MDDRCVVCGREVPEGRQVCYLCEWASKLPNTSEVSHEMTAREFIEIWNRLCKSYNTSPCEECPVYEWCMGPPRIAEYKEMEAVLVKWAAEHPEKKRKTYAQDFCERFPKVWRRNGIPSICRNEVYKGKSCPLGMQARFDPDCAACWNEEMEDEE